MAAADLTPFRVLGVSCESEHVIVSCPFPSAGRSRQQYQLDLVADSATGFVTEAALRDPDGKVIKEILQFNPMLLPNDVELPGCRIDASFFDGKLQGITALTIESAVVNEQVEDSEFELSAREGSIVLDMRADPNKPEFFIVGADTQNVREFTPKIANGPKGNYGAYALATLAIGIVIAISAYLRRAVRSR